MEDGGDDGGGSEHSLGSASQAGLRRSPAEVAARPAVPVSSTAGNVTFAKELLRDPTESFALVGTDELSASDTAHKAAISATTRLIRAMAESVCLICACNYWNH